MPHLTLEYTSNIQQAVSAKDVFAQLHRVLADVGGVKIGHCKSRLRVLDDFYIAEGEQGGAFVHLDLRLLAGRDLALKQRIGNESLQVLRQYFAPGSDALSLQITVSVIDIERETYFKIPEGTI